MTTAFVLAGGGSLGAIQVGMLQALAEVGMEPDLLVGTSAGALNAAWVAGHGVGADSLDRPPRTTLGAPMHALSLLIERRLQVEIRFYADKLDLAVVPHLCPLAVHAADFRQAGELIDRSRLATREWLLDQGREAA